MPVHVSGVGIPGSFEKRFFLVDFLHEHITKDIGIFEWDILKCSVNDFGMILVKKIPQELGGYHDTSSSRFAPRKGDL